MNIVKNLSDRVLNRMVTGSTAKAAGTVTMACRCAPTSPTICNGHEYLCNGQFVRCC